MRFSFFSQLLLALLFTSGVAAQGGTIFSTPTGSSDWFVEPLPENSYVPNQMIAYYNVPFIKASYIEDDMQADGYNVTVKKLTEHEALITFVDGFEEDSNCIEGECGICEIIGNPGSGPGNSSHADGLWPNYYVYSGMPAEFTPNPADNLQEVANPFPDNQFDPLLFCSGGTSIPQVRIGDQSVSIAILDSGIEVDRHERFFGPKGNSIVQWHRVGNENASYFNSDPYGHGTAVGYLAAHQFVKSGKQDQITLHSYRVLNNKGTGTLAQVLTALEDAIEEGVDIVNMSFGFVGLECDEEAQSSLSHQLATARANGILVFASAGNDGNPLESLPQFPAADRERGNVITVGATTCGPYSRWSYSNYGAAHVDLMAPGTSIFVPFVPGVRPFGFIKTDGTSFATPIAASVAAGYLSLTNAVQTRCLLLYRDSKEEIPGENDSFAGPIDLRPNDICYSRAFGDLINFTQIGAGEGGFDFGEINPRGAVTPNPFNGSITVATNVSGEGESADVAIFNTSGNLVKFVKSNQPSTQINTNDLQAGVYYLRITKAGEIRTVKIIKQ